ncbi:MAG: trypsin-like peptidase domain-containing protein [Candidatus Promineifilaceae bacterium]|nr:trypsin-like peptidase domain-containing protein [Candidatus Promineifilaceae bacterium]
MTADPDEKITTPSFWRRIQRLIRWFRRRWLYAAPFVAALAGAYLYGLLFPGSLPLSQEDVDQRVAQAMASATPEPPQAAQVFQVIAPSLVVIQNRGDDLEGDRGVGIGSGVVINQSGDILTALHVVADAVELEVAFADGTEARAEIVATDPDNDIAVLHPHRPPELMVPAVLGSPDRSRIGDEAFAVGNPLGLFGSLSAGVISGFDRSIPAEVAGRRMEGLIQFDAAVNPGNSGGPLLNGQGQVIGIVTALINPTSQNSFSGIGFAVPIATAASAADAPEY